MAYSASVFLYDSELWALETLEKHIDTFQRKLLRRVIDIRWPKVITNEKLHELTKTDKWSKVIRRRRLNWLGHLEQEKTPVRLELKESISNTRTKFGRPKLTWLNTIKKDLLLFNIELDLNLNEIQIESHLSGTDKRDNGK